ncbi:MULTISPECIES: MFS transporter [unclassified Bradyrhizobium]|uniref:MFS transporter n=1 Tax=unclassified Bradyrhizobium TaxID=2631580 RepID=UPI00143D7F34|nr:MULTISPECIES: MFS transporter [unclassified Bradyrhizobium]
MMLVSAKQDREGESDLHPTVDVGDVIDRRLSRYQLGVFFLCAMVVVLDGIDTQVLGIGAPLIVKELAIAPALFGWLFSAATIGAVIGAVICGVLADRVGRKRVLILATGIFGLATLATGLAGSFTDLVVWRFVTGVGLGGAVPCFVALTSEYAPARWRARIVTLMWASFPLGASAGAFINSYIVTYLGWRPLFFLWGAMPLVAALILMVALPESVRFLVARGGRADRVRRIVNRIDPGSASATTVFVARADSNVEGKEDGTPIDLFRQRFAVPSWSLAVISFMTFGTLTLLATWTPTLLAAQGAPPSAGAITVSVYGLGSFLGTSAAGLLFSRFSIVRTTLPAVLGACLAIASIGLVAPAPVPVNIVYVLVGLFLGACSSGAVALAAIVYPTTLRSTGIGWVMGSGRAGAVAGPLIVGMMIAGGWPLSRMMLAVGLSMTVLVPALLLLSRGRLRGD